MNRIYKLIWNSSSNAWVAVSELAKGRGKGKKVAINATALVMMLGGGSVWAVGDKYEWNTANSGNWSDGSNWNVNGQAQQAGQEQAPTQNDNAYIDTVGTATVGASVQAAANSLFVGDENQGQIEITDGGNLNVGTDASIGNGSLGTGTVLVFGANSKLTVGNDFEVGGSGKGNLSIKNGGVVKSKDTAIGFGVGSTGTVTVEATGSAFDSTGDLIVGRKGTGTLTISDGAAVSNVASNKTLYVGRDSTSKGTLSILSGGTLNSRVVLIGYEKSSVGTVTVDGNGSTLVSTSDLGVGELGNGSLTISNGGVASSGFSYIGGGTDSDSDVTVTGAGSKWDVTSLQVGTFGKGSLTINNGATATVSNGPVDIGFNGDSQGTVVVTGTNSKWITSGIFTVGSIGTGSMTISDGGSVDTNSAASIGAFTNGTGTVTVDGIGSAWTTVSEISISKSSDSHGTLTVSNGGTVTVTSDEGSAIRIGASPQGQTPGGTGTINIGAAEGQTAVAAGVLQTDAVVFGLGTGKMVFNHTSDFYNFAPAISGAGDVKLLSGTTRLYGDMSQYTGALTIDGGMLRVSSSDTIALGGNYTQTANGTLRIAVSDDTTYGKLVVTGTATLPSNTKIDVAVDNPDFKFTATSLDAVISAGTLVSDGTFAVTDNSVLFNFGAVKDGNTVDLTISPAGPDSFEAIVVAEGNTVAVGAATALDTIIAEDPTGSVANLFVPFTTDAEVNTAVTQTLPLLTGNLQAATFEALAGIDRVIGARIEANRGISSGDVFYGDKKIWMKPFGAWANQNNRGSVAGYKADTYGLAVGTDATISETTQLGLSFAYANASVNSKSSVAPNSATVDAFQLVGYGSYSFDENTQLDFQVGVGQNLNKGTRNLTSFGLTAKSSYSSWTATASADLNRTYALSNTTRVTPSLWADYSWIQDGSYNETGAGALSLNVKGRSANELILGVGGKIEHDFDSNTSVNARLGVGYDVINEQNYITAAFAGAPVVAFNTQGISPDPWVVRAGVGFARDIQANTQLSIRYDAEYREGFLNQTASLNLRWRF